METKTKYFQRKESTVTHTDDMCDRCQKEVGKDKLKKLPFLYMAKNDNIHEDMSEVMTIMTGRHYEPGYRQYYVCENCYKNEVTGT